MKKIFTLLFFVLSIATFAQTYNGDLTLTSQAEVDAFNYKRVNGTLTIKGYNITNIDSLKILLRSGSIIIDSTNITNLFGLKNDSALYNINKLTISNNPNLTNVRDLNTFISSVNNANQSYFEEINITNNSSLNNIDNVLCD